MTTPKYVTPEQVRKAAATAGDGPIKVLFDMGLIAYEPVTMNETKEALAEPKPDPVNWKAVAEGWQTNSDMYKAKYHEAKDRVAKLEEELKVAQNWEDTARQYSRNADYYRNICAMIGEIIGKEAYVADDGTVSDDVLIDKLPELVSELVQHNRAMKYVLKYNGLSK